MRARTTIPMITRMRQLHRAGLSYAAIAAVISLDRQLDPPLSEDAVRNRLVRELGLRRGRAGVVGMAKPENGSNLPPNAGGRKVAV